MHAVFVNGEFAGYGTDSRLASEYDITALTRRGKNDVAIVVMRYSAETVRASAYSSGIMLLLLTLLAFGAPLRERIRKPGA